MSTKEIIVSMLDSLTERQLESIAILIESFSVPNQETLEAIEESEKMLKDPDTKIYDSLEELFEDLKS